MHTLLDFAVIGFTLFNTYESNKVKIEILKLKLWITNNFHAKNSHVEN